MKVNRTGLSFDEAMAALHTGAEAAAPWRDGWESSQASFPQGGPDFLRPQYVRRTCQWLGYSQEVLDVMLEALKAFESSEALVRLAWHCHRTAFASGSAPQELRALMSGWPRPPRVLSDVSPMFYAIVLLSGVAHVLAMHERRGISEDVTRETLSDLEICTHEFKGKYGAWGFENTGWLAKHFSGMLFMLGRLQFCFEHFKRDHRAYRNCDDGRVLLFAGEGMRFRADGQHDGSCGIYDPQGAWTARFSDDGRTVRGNAISSDGRALSEVVELSRARWRLILKRGDPMLGIHITEGAALVSEQCGESFERAVEFYATYFPERPFKGFQCSSWLLDNQFCSLLPESSNIRKFQQEVYLYPMLKQRDFRKLEYVFGRDIKGVDDAPQDTTLQRIIISRVRQGGNFGGGGCLLFPEDLPWGRQIYRRACK